MLTGIWGNDLQVQQMWIRVIRAKAGSVAGCGKRLRGRGATHATFVAGSLSACATERLKGAGDKRKKTDSQYAEITLDYTLGKIEHFSESVADGRLSL